MHPDPTLGRHASEGPLLELTWTQGIKSKHQRRRLNLRLQQPDRKIGVDIGGRICESRSKKRGKWFRREWVPPFIVRNWGGSDVYTFGRIGTQEDWNQEGRERADISGGPKVQAQPWDQVPVAGLARVLCEMRLLLDSSTRRHDPWEKVQRIYRRMLMAVHM